MYLQGIRGLSPLDASLLLVPGYVAGSFLGPIMGRLSDKYGSREIATLGVFFLALAIVVYLTMTTTSSLYIVLDRFSRVRLRNLHVLPSQQQRSHGKRPPRFIRQHLRRTKNSAEHWVSRKLRVGDFGCSSLGTTASSF